MKLTGNEKGSMDLGSPLIIMAILGAIVLSKLWDGLGLPLRIIGTAVVAALALIGLFLMSQPTGMGANWAREEVRRRVEEEKKKADGGEEE